jgi:uncharacterized protein YqhQ
MAKEKLPSYGGQALIEGVLMRGSRYVAGAFRNPQGEIIVESEELDKIYLSKIKKIPFVRGLLMLWDALVLGTRYLTISANLQTDEDEKIEGATLYVTLFTSLAIGIGLFFLLPAALGQLAEQYLHWSNFLSNLAEGLIRLVLMLVYIWGIGKMKDIQRVFSYHGAEHKTINAFEAGEELTPANVSKYSVEHPRCGTGFLLTLVVISILFFAILPQMNMLGRLASRIILLPVLTGIAYEYIRWTGNHLNSKLISLLIRPNLAMQHLVTNEPDEEMLEVAITAFKTMYDLEKGSQSLPDNDPVVP